MSHCPPQNPTCTGVELNPGFNGDRPANNRSSYGTTNTEDMELSQRVWSRRKSPGRLCNVDWSIVALRKLHFLSKRRWIFTSSHPKRLKHANFTFCETRIVIIIREENQQDAPLSHQFIPIKLSSTCFEQTSSSSGGYSCTHSVQYFSRINVVSSC